MFQPYAVVVIHHASYVRITRHKTWRRARQVFENLVRREGGQMCSGDGMEAWLDSEHNTLAYVTRW